MLLGAGRRREAVGERQGSVHHPRDDRPPRPEQHKVPVKLKKGTNAVLLKVANGNNPHGFYFSLTSAEELKRK